MEKTHDLIRVLKYFFLYLFIATLAVPMLLYLLVYLMESIVWGHETSLEALMNNSMIDDASLILGNFCLIVLFIKKKYTSLNWAEKPWTQIGKQKNLYLWAILLELASILPINLLVVWLNLSDYSTALDTDSTLTLGSVIGIVCFAPLAEELVMRGAIEEKLLQAKRSAGVAIGLSAFLFAILHVYPSLMINAFLCGLVTGWVYYRTRNVLLCVAMHITANGLSCLIDWMQPGNPISEFAHETRIIFLALFSLVFMVYSISQLKKLTGLKD